MLEGVEWGEYRLGDLFDKVTTATLRYKTSTLPSYSFGEYTLPALTAGIQNQGLNNYVPREGATILSNVISISANGANTGATFYQPHEFCVLQDAYAIHWIYSNRELSLQCYLFITSAISSAIYGKYEWTNKAGWSRVKDEIIQLPSRNGEIDYEFMERFIAELNALRIAELNAYLTITGLKDYTLTPEEKQAIKDFEAKHIEWSEYKMGKLFRRRDTKKLFYKAKGLPKEPKGEYTLPCLTSSFLNQGLNYYAPRKKATILKDVISIPSNSDVYRAYYQSRDFTVLSDAYAIEWAYGNKKMSREQYLFLVSSINQVTDLPIYSYKNKLGGWTVVKDKRISLPTLKGEIDYALMETLISAIQKMVIKDVVLYADREIEETKQVVDKTYKRNSI